MGFVGLHIDSLRLNGGHSKLAKRNFLLHIVVTNVVVCVVIAEGIDAIRAGRRQR